MEAIILAGGLGTRLREAVPGLPKAMAPVCGRPFLEILISSLAGRGFHRLILSLGYLAEKVVEHFGSGFAGIELVYEVESRPLGTGGALRRALSRSLSDHVFVFNGDTYLDLEAGEIERQWLREQVPIIVAAERTDTSRYARLQVAGGRLVGFAEKGAAGKGLINAGCYVFPRNIERHFPDEDVFSLERDFLEKAVMRMPFDVFVCRGRFIDIGVPDDYERAQAELADCASLLQKTVT